MEATDDININTQCGVRYGDIYWNLAFLNYNITKVFFNAQSVIFKGMYAQFLQLKSLSSKQVEASISHKPTINSTDDLVSSIIPNKDKAFSSLLKKLATEEKKLEQGAMSNKLNFIASNNPLPNKDKTPQQVLKEYGQVENKADVAFRLAADKGNVSDMKILLTNFKIDINKQSSNGNTALHWACKKNHREVMDYLIGLEKIDRSIINKEQKKAE